MTTTTVRSNNHYVPDSPIHTRVFLRPIAAPLALGLSAYATSTFIISTWLTRWYGDSNSPYYVWPFILLFGGFSQILSGMWAFLARDTISTVFHTMWGSFWVYFSLLYALMSFNIISPFGIYDKNSSLAICMLCLTVLTLLTAFTSISRNIAVFATYLLVGIGSLFATIGWFKGNQTVIDIAGYLWIISSFTSLIAVTHYLFLDSVLIKSKTTHNYFLNRFTLRGFGEAYFDGVDSGSYEAGVSKNY